MITEDKSRTLEVSATQLTRVFMTESGNNRGSINNRGHDIAVDLLLEEGEDVRFYDIAVMWVGGAQGIGSPPRPTVSITAKDVVTVLGEQT